MSFKKFLFPILLLLAVFASVAWFRYGNHPEREARYLAKGTRLYEQHDYARAALEFKNAIRMVPVDPEPYYQLGLTVETEGDIRTAFALYMGAAQQNAHYAPALLKLAQYYLAGNQDEEAQKCVDTVLATHPNDAEAHALRAALLLREKDFSGTAREAAVALRADPGNITAYSALAGLNLAQGSIPHAVAETNEGISHHPQELSLYLLKAELYRQAGDTAQLIATYHSIFNLRPQTKLFRVTLVDMLIDAGKTDAAEQELRSAIAAFPADWEFKHRLISFLAEHRSMDAAEKELAEFRQSAPSGNDLDIWLSYLYASHGMENKATDLLTRIIANDTDSAHATAARLLLARIYLHQAHVDQASALIEQTLNDQPVNQEALFLKASIEYRQGLYQNALSDLRKIVRDHPREKQALQLLAEVLVRQGYMDLAIDTVNQWVEADPGNPEARMRLAQLYALNGDDEHAFDVLDALTKSDPDYAPAWETIARISLGSKDQPRTDAAIQVLSGLPGQQMATALLQGESFTNKGESEKAGDAYKQVIDANPASPLAERAITALISLKRKQGNLNEATRYLENLKSANPIIKTRLAECYMELGDTMRAQVLLDTIIAARPSIQDPYLDRARIYLRAHDATEALSILQTAFSAVPADMRAPLMTGDILETLNRHADAIALYGDLLKRDAGLHAAANNYAAIIADFAYNDPEMLAKARQAAERFAGSSNPLLLDTLAWVYYRERNYAQATALMQRIFALPGQKPAQIHYHYGMILLQTGNRHEAQHELGLASAGADSYPGHENAKTAFEQLNADNIKK